MSYVWMVYAKRGVMGCGGYASAWIEVEAGEGVERRGPMDPYPLFNRGQLTKQNTIYPQFILHPPRLHRSSYPSTHPKLQDRWMNEWLEVPFFFSFLLFFFQARGRLRGQGRGCAGGGTAGREGWGVACIATTLYCTSPCGDC